MLDSLFKSSQLPAVLAQPRTSLTGKSSLAWSLGERGLTGSETLQRAPGRRFVPDTLECTLQSYLAKLLLKVSGSPPIQLTVGRAAPVCFHDNPVASVNIRDTATLVKLVLNHELNFGDAYSDGSVAVEGDLVQFLVACLRARSHSLSRSWRLTELMDPGRSNTLDGSRRNIHHHYDLGNDFYRLWLDRDMVYTCAYFPTRDITLDAAQQAKLDHVCKKLQLRPGERIVDAGCGWGAFALHAAKYYGVMVKAFSISHEQIIFARERASSLGLQGSVEFIEDDYRNVAGKYDVFVSIGMLEHVGRGQYRDLGRVIDRILQQSGRGFIHSIGQDTSVPLNPWIEKRIFPGAYPPTLREMSDILEPWRFTVLDVENLRPHYALTIEHWLKRFEDNHDRVTMRYGESFVRAWRFYLAASIAAFRTGELQLFQLLFSRPDCNNIPWTRDYIYRGVNCNGPAVN